LFGLGAPLEGFASETDDLTEQYTLYEGFYEGWERVTWPYFDKKNGPASSAYGGEHVKGDLEIR